MKTKEKIKELFQKIRNFFSQRHYDLQEVFGCPEQPPQNCPTFLERKIHKRFLDATNSQNIIVVYGESRQGKTWTIDRYCPNQMRIGCTASMDIKQIKKDMLHAVNVDIREIEHSITEEYSAGNNVYTEVGTNLVAQAGGGVTTAVAHCETLKTTYKTVEVDDSEEFLQTLVDRSGGRFFVFDNFHYLAPQVQQQFCSLLKEFNYRNIKVIIVGVWKESSKITALAPDLVNRCTHIDIGSWNDKELQQVTDLGTRALNVDIATDVVALFKRCCASNIGIYKDFLQKFCQYCEISKTQRRFTKLENRQAATEAAEAVIREAYNPLRDRIKNLTTPQRARKESKNVRKKIVAAIITLIIKENTVFTQNGLDVDKIHKEVDNICRSQGKASIQPSNVTQELGNLHLREENRQTGQNFIPLFYFDKTNRKLLVIEPTIYVIKEYNCSLLQKILDELLEIE